jgi:ubiquitin carboxyl-terminal hydrolase L3
MDGRKPFPINHGPCTEFLADTCKVIQKFMDREPDALQFTMMALCQQE